MAETTLPQQPSHERITLDLMQRTPALALPWRCPLCPEQPEMALAAIVLHLNDYHQRKREWVADWLDTLGLDLFVYDRPVWSIRPWGSA